MTISSSYPRASKLKGKWVVIKFGGSSIENVQELDRFCRDIATLVHLGIRPIIVHGGGPGITEEMKRRELPVKKVFGLRVTDDQTLEVAKYVLTRINDQIVRGMHRAGLKSLGLAGGECNLLVCAKKLPVRGKDATGMEIEADLGWVGEPVRANPKVLKDLGQRGFVPVVYTICGDPGGRLMNVNADTAAAFLAKAIKAEDFMLVTDVPGLMRRFGDPSSVIPIVKVSDFEHLVQEGVVKEGMIPKLEACILAVQGGVKAAHMVDGKNPDAILGQLLREDNLGTKIIRG